MNCRRVVCRREVAFSEKGRIRARCLRCPPPGLGRDSHQREARRRQANPASPRGTFSLPKRETPRLRTALNAASLPGSTTRRRGPTKRTRFASAEHTLLRCKKLESIRPPLCARQRQSRQQKALGGAAKPCRGPRRAGHQPPAPQRARATLRGGSRADRRRRGRPARRKKNRGALESLSLAGRLPREFRSRRKWPNRRPLAKSARWRHDRKKASTNRAPSQKGRRE